jgi:hypothetical protein
MSRPAHFEIQTDNPEKTREFYEKVFGWKFQKWDGPMNYWMITTGEGYGIDGGMALKNEADAPPCNTIDVEDVDKYIELVKENGGEIVAPKMEIPGIGFLAYIKDPDGALWGIMKDTSQQE